MKFKMLIKKSSIASLWSFVSCFILVSISTQAWAFSLNQPQIMMHVDNNSFIVTLADTKAAQEFLTMLPLVFNMADYNRNEKHVRLPKSLTANAARAGTIQNGDLMLFGTNTLVLFYLTFDSSYSYTRIGQVQDPSKLKSILGKGKVQITFTSL